MALPIGFACAQPAQVTVRLAGRPGDEMSANAALVSRHLGRHLGAAPVTAAARTTVSSIDLLNDFAKDAPDGSALLLAPPLAAFMQAAGAPGVAYDAGKFAWIGSLSSAPLVLAASWVTGFKSIEDGRRREMDLGAIGDTGVGAIYPALINSIARARFRVASSYRSDTEIDAAMESGEIGGRLAPWSNFAFNRSALFAQGKLNFLLQIGAVKNPALGAAPLLTDVASSDADRAVAAFASIDPAHGLSVAAPPGTPAEAVERLRKAFSAMVADPAFQDDARASGVEVSASDGAAVAKLIAAELATPPGVLARTRAVLGSGRN